MYDLDRVYEGLHDSSERILTPTMNVRLVSGACSAIVLDEDGSLLAESATLSSALWAMAQVSITGETPRSLWANEFYQVSEIFKDRVAAFKESRQAVIGAGDFSILDEMSLLELLNISHQVSGVARVPKLASSRIIISSVAVSRRRTDDAAANIDFLNSFFLEDLAGVMAGISDGDCRRHCLST